MDEQPFGMPKEIGKRPGRMIAAADGAALLCLACGLHHQLSACSIPRAVWENTYITEPGDGRFQRHKVQAVLKQVLHERMEKQKYDPVKGAQIAKQLADDLREKVKLLGYERYKLVIQVTIGQKIGQAMRIVSRCLWDTSCDNFASEYFENESLYCVCQVYGLYCE